MDIRATNFTVKIFGEGLTEWYYFDKLRSKKLFSFTLNPGFPAKSRSSYKKRLPLIDAELNRPDEERADLIVLITDLDNIVGDSAQYREYIKDKKLYENRGVIFIESHPCIELWFLYHFNKRYEKSTYTTYDEIKGPLRKHLPGYEKSKAYYTGNTTFRDFIIDSLVNRAKASVCAEASCGYPAIEDEISNHTNLHRLVIFLHMMQFCYILADILRSMIHKSFSFEPDVRNLENITIKVNGNYLASLKASRGRITCISEESNIEIPLNSNYEECSPLMDSFINNLATKVRDSLAD